MSFREQTQVVIQRDRLPVARVQPIPTRQRSLNILTGAVVGFLIVVGLQWGRPVLIPIGLAVLLTILLSPIVQLLQSKGLGRVVSVMVTVSAVGIFLTCLGWMVTRQVTGILAELPQNTATIKAKLVSLRQLGSGPNAERFGQMIEEINRELKLPAHRGERSAEWAAGPDGHFDSGFLKSRGG